MLRGIDRIALDLPGHGRTPLDSHVDLPRVDASRDVLDAEDLAPFRALADLPLGMTAHIVFDALDPALPFTLSATAIAEVRAATGFDGLLMTDDLSMHALSGGFADRTADALAAGCDLVLHCNGDRAEMAAVAGALPSLSGRAAERAARALALRDALGGAGAVIDIAAERAALDALAREVGHA